MRRLGSEKLDNWFALILGVAGAPLFSMSVIAGITTGRYIYRNRFMSTGIEIFWSDTPFLFVGLILVQTGFVLLCLELAWFGLYHIARKTQRFGYLPVRYKWKFFAVAGMVVVLGTLVAVAEYVR